MPTDGWFTRSSPDNPVQIYDRGNSHKAVVNRDGYRIRIYDLNVSRIRPVLDTGEDDWAQSMIMEALA